jgi:replicative DNA helicase
MKPTAPIYHLKRDARHLSRTKNIPLHQALDRVAQAQGFANWSLLAAKALKTVSALELFLGLKAGETLLIAARPRQGKTLVSLRLAIEAMQRGGQAALFTLDDTEHDVRGRFEALGEDMAQYGDRFALDASDAISAVHMVERLTHTPRGGLVIVDYLQILDQKRDKPALMDQVRILKQFARDKGLILAFISQIDRAYDASSKPFPDLGDVRLPNPLDLALFDKACFVNRGEIRLHG